MSDETIKTYQGSSIGASQCLVTLEGFIGDMENAELCDGSTVDASDAVTAINGLIWEIERREAEVESEREGRAKLADALSQKDAAMGVLFDRLAKAGVDCSDLIS